MTDPVIPEGEGPMRAYPFRLPRSLVARLDAAAKATNNTRTAVVVRLLTWALDERDRQSKKR